VQAAWRKYPNPQNPNVTGLDVVDRKLDNAGVLHSHRLMRTEWGLPRWATELIGIDRPCYVSEHSEVNPDQKLMTLKSRNVTFSNFVSIDEQLIYEPHPTEPDKTLLKQEAVITVSGVPLTSYMESIVMSGCNSNAGKGREAMEWVINHIKVETTDLRKKALGAVLDIDRQLTRETADLKKKALGAVVDIDRQLTRETADLKKKALGAVEEMDQVMNQSRGSSL